MAATIAEFDWGAATSTTPAGVKVRRTRGILHIVRETAARNESIVVVKYGDEFHMFAFNHTMTTALDPIQNCTPRNFVMRTDSAQRILKLLGFSK